jgi:hypothetical protein
MLHLRVKDKHAALLSTGAAVFVGIRFLAVPQGCDVRGLRVEPARSNGAGDCRAIRPVPPPTSKGPAQMAQKPRRAALLGLYPV